MTAFKNLPPWDDFVKGRESDMLRMRKAFDAKLMTLHRATMAKYSDMRTPEDEIARFAEWKDAQARKPKRVKRAPPVLPPCEACAMWYSAQAQ